MTQDTKGSCEESSYDFRYWCFLVKRYLFTWWIHMTGKYTFKRNPTDFKNIWCIYTLQNYELPGHVVGVLNHWLMVMVSNSAPLSSCMKFWLGCNFFQIWRNDQKMKNKQMWAVEDRSSISFKVGHVYVLWCFYYISAIFY